jgi:hypothetical protein
MTSPVNNKSVENDAIANNAFENNMTPLSMNNVITNTPLQSAQYAEKAAAATGTQTNQQIAVNINAPQQNSDPDKVANAARKNLSNVANKV